MPTTPEAVPVPPSAELDGAARRSLRRSIERRAAARQARRRRLTGRTSALAIAGAMAIGSAGAVAADGTGGATAGSPASKAARGGASVAAIQRALGVTADGVLGPQTRRAIRAFQRRKGLAVDGIAGPQTLAALGLARSSSTPPALTESMPGSTATRTRRAPKRRTAPSAALQKIAACESGGNPAAVSADGRYRGKYQFSRATWRAMGGKGDPAAAPEAEQDRIAAALYAAQGSSPWPSCG